jgi:hypothetical protein
MTNENDVLARLEKIERELERQAQRRRIAGVVALIVFLGFIGLIALPEIAWDVISLAIGGFFLFVFIGIWINAGDKENTRGEIERRRKAGEASYQPQQ